MGFLLLPLPGSPSAQAQPPLPLGGFGTARWQVTEGLLIRPAEPNAAPARDLPALVVGAQRGKQVAVRTFSGPDDDTPRTSRGFEAPESALRFPELSAWSDPDETFPLQVQIQVRSPIAPRAPVASRVPLALVDLTLRNPGGTPVLTSVGLSWPALEPGLAWQNFELNGVRGTAALDERGEGLALSLPRGLMGEPIPDLDGGTPDWFEFAAGGRVHDGTHGGMVGLRFILPPGGERRLPFYVAWTPPSVINSWSILTPDSGHRPSRALIPDITPPLLTEAIHGNRERLVREMTSWQGALEASSLEDWMREDLLHSPARLTAQARADAEGRLLFVSSYADPGPLVGDPAADLLHHGYLRALHPEIEESLLRFYAAAQERTGPGAGSIPGPLGEIRRLEGLDSARPPSRRPDPLRATCAWIIQVAGHHRASADPAFLAQSWAPVRRAVTWLFERDGNADSLPECADGATRSPEALLYLAALRAALELAQDLEELQHIDIYQAKLAAGRQSFLEQFWTADGVKFQHDLLSGEQNPNSRLDVLQGEAGLARFGLPAVLEADLLRLEWKRLYRHHVRGGWNLPPLEMTPDGELVERSISTGQVLDFAMLGIRLGFMEEGYALARRVTELQNLREVTAIPDRLRRTSAWVAPEGIPAATGAASSAPLWDLLPALSGVSLDVPDGTLKLTPALPPGSEVLRCPVYHPAFRGWLEYDPAEEILNLTITRLFVEEPFEIRNVQGAWHEEAVPLDRPIEIREGTELNLWRYASAWLPRDVLSIERGNPSGPEWETRSAAPDLSGQTSRYAVDGNPATRWSTVRPMEPGDWFEIDLGETRLLSRLALDFEQFPGAWPRGLRVEVAHREGAWSDLRALSEAECAALAASGELSMAVEDVPARWIRFVQRGKSENPWAIGEIHVDRRTAP